jgi:hypothetical protein
LGIINRNSPEGGGEAIGSFAGIPNGREPISDEPSPLVHPALKREVNKYGVTAIVPKELYLVVTGLI